MHGFLEAACATMIGAIAGLLFVATLETALRVVTPGNREMHPALVWLNLLPPLTPIWYFVTVSAVGRSLRNQHEVNGWPNPAPGGAEYGYAAGAFALLSFVGMMCGINAPQLTVLGWMFAVGCFAAYWLSLARAIFATRRVAVIHGAGEIIPRTERGFDEPRDGG